MCITIIGTLLKTWIAGPHPQNFSSSRFGRVHKNLFQGDAAISGQRILTLRSTALESGDILASMQREQGYSQQYLY